MIIISAESCCDLPAEYVKTHNIKIMTHYIVTRRGQFYDGIEVTGRNVIEYKNYKGYFPKSKSPKVEHYRSEFKKYLEEAESVIHITPGIQSYKSYGNAVYASKGFENVYVLDSSQISCGYGMIVKEACRLRDMGYNAERIISELEKYKHKIRTYMVVKELSCLGDIDKSIAKFGGIMKFLNVYPLFHIQGDKYIFKSLVFGGQTRMYKDFIRKIPRRIRNDAQKVIITSKYNNKDIKELSATLVRFGGEEFKNTPIMQVSCSEICRYGEDMLGIIGIK